MELVEALQGIRNIPKAFRVDNEWLKSKRTYVHNTLYVQSFVCLDLSSWKSRSREAAFRVRKSTSCPQTLLPHTRHTTMKTAQHKTVKQAQRDTTNHTRVVTHYILTEQATVICLRSSPHEGHGCVTTHRTPDPLCPWHCLTTGQTWSSRLIQVLGLRNPTNRPIHLRLLDARWLCVFCACLAASQDPILSKGVKQDTHQPQHKMSDR